MQTVTFELKQIAMDYLFDGMILNEDIYNFDGKVLLLSKGTVLSRHQISQLSKFNANSRNISVFSDTYQRLITHGLPKTGNMTQAYVEEKLHYAELKEGASSMLESAAKSNKVSKKDADGITADIMVKLHTLEPALILQCISSPGRMDEYLHRHSVNVGMLNGMIGKWLNLDDDDVDRLVLVGLMHDIGKTKIPQELLNAPRGLTVCEFEVMKMHPVYSYELLGTDARFTDDIRLGALEHHEKMNGTGYPYGISSDKISPFARVTTVSDVYDAMISNRAYRSANNPFRILSDMSEHQFSDLDIGLVSLFTKHLPGELIGKTVLLSDNSVGIVKYIPEEDFEHPLVEVDGEIKKTDDKFTCVGIIWDE